MVSPFLDLATVKSVGAWGGKGARRILLSTPVAMDAIAAQDDQVITSAFQEILQTDTPEQIAVGSDPLEDEPHLEIRTAEGEQLAPAGLHAKLLYTALGSDRRLWLGSANATGRAWDGRNHEIVAEIALGAEPARALLDFVREGNIYVPDPSRQAQDEGELALEHARNLLCGSWRIWQSLAQDRVTLSAGSPPPIITPDIKLEVAALNQKWLPWPLGASSMDLGTVPLALRTDFVQLRLISGERTCAWIMLARFDPPLNVARNNATLAQYLTPSVYLQWIRSVLAATTSGLGGGEWDRDDNLPQQGRDKGEPHKAESVLPTVEEILRAWARDPQSIVEVNQRMVSYCGVLERRTRESGQVGDADLLVELQDTWQTIATELLTRTR